MEHAQFYLLTTLELRRDAIGAIAGKITAALGSRNSDDAIKQIAGQMQAFLASDVVYSQRVIPNINKALDDNGIGGQHIQTSTFFDDFSWLAPQTVATKLGQSLSESAGGKPAPGTHGFGLVSTAVGNQVLNPDGGNSVTATADLAFSHGQGAEPGREQRDQRQGADHRQRLGQADHRPAHGRLGAARRNGHGHGAARQDAAIGAAVTVKAEVVRSTARRRPTTTARTIRFSSSADPGAAAVGRPPMLSPWTT